MDKYDVQTNDFMIVVKPHLDKKNKWTGEVTLKMVVDKANKLDDDDFYSMISFNYNFFCIFNFSNVKFYTNNLLWCIHGDCYVACNGFGFNTFTFFIA